MLNPFAPSHPLSAGKKGRRTVCLNCGCHQTPQWRCGPLGPRTLCNACGVRYTKDLPLNCWPIRDGMVLPPVRGAGSSALSCDMHGGACSGATSVAQLRLCVPLVRR